MNGGARGFTLIEVLASLALVLILLPVVMQGVTLALGAEGEARARLWAAQAADAQLARLLATGEWQRGEQTGELGAAAPGATWSLAVAPRSDIGLQELTLTVRWSVRGRARELNLTTLAAGETP